MFTHASQVRLSQRSADAGKWIVPEVYIEESSASDPEVWTDASDSFDTVGCFMSSVGNIVNFQYAAKRVTISNGNIYRLVFPFREDTITTPQSVGEMAVISTDEDDRHWAIYPLVGTPEGRLETLDAFNKQWLDAAVGDVVQYYGTWFI